jgi:hypothetical protein
MNFPLPVDVYSPREYFRRLSTPSLVLVLLSIELKTERKAGISSHQVFRFRLTDSHTHSNILLRLTAHKRQLHTSIAVSVHHIVLTFDMIECEEPPHIIASRERRDDGKQKELSRRHRDSLFQ